MKISSMSSCLGKVKVFSIILACWFQSTFNVCVKTANEFYVFQTELNGWVFVYELSGCGIDSRCSYLNFKYRACFEQGNPWLYRFTFNRVCDMIITHSSKLYCWFTLYTIYSRIHLRFNRMEQFQSRLARIGSKQFLFISLHKKWSFLLRISSVNVTKSAGNCGFGHIY